MKRGWMCWDVKCPVDGGSILLGSSSLKEAIRPYVFMTLIMFFALWAVKSHQSSSVISENHFLS